MRSETFWERDCLRGLIWGMGGDVWPWIGAETEVEGLSFAIYNRCWLADKRRVARVNEKM